MQGMGLQDRLQAPSLIMRDINVETKTPRLLSYQDGIKTSNKDGAGRRFADGRCMAYEGRVFGMFIRDLKNVSPDPENIQPPCHQSSLWLSACLTPQGPTVHIPSDLAPIIS